MNNTHAIRNERAQNPRLLRLGEVLCLGASHPVHDLIGGAIGIASRWWLGMTV